MMPESAAPAQAVRPLDYDLLSHLFLMAYDGFVINRRLNDLRDIDRLVDTVCEMMLPVGQAGGTADPDHRPAVKAKTSRTKPRRSDRQDA